MNPRIALLAACTLLATACAAEDGDMEDVGASEGAATRVTAELLAQHEAEMQRSLAGATLEVRAEFQINKGFSWVGSMGPGAKLASCGVYTTERDASITIPRGDVYRIIAKSSRLEYDGFSDSYTWSIELTNERTKSGATGTPAAFRFHCPSYGSVMSAKKMAAVLDHGAQMTSEVPTTVMRLVGFK